MKLAFLETERRKKFLQATPLKRVLVFAKRQNPMRGGMEINPMTGKPWSSTICFAWFVWEHGYEGEPTVGWI